MRRCCGVPVTTSVPRCAPRDGPAARVIATAILDQVLRHVVTVEDWGNSHGLKDKLRFGLMRSEAPSDVA